jgi:flagellar FliL protein
VYDIVYKLIITKERIIMAEAVENTEVEVKKSGNSNILLIVVASVLFLILVGGGVAGYLLLNEDEEVLNDANKAVATQQQTTQKKETTKSIRSTNYAEIGQMYPMDQFVVNLYSESGSRYLKAALNFEITGEELAAELDAKKPLIRDIIIKALSAKTYEEISTIKGKENLKDEIVANVNEVITDGKINNLFFTDFVIQ